MVGPNGETANVGPGRSSPLESISVGEGGVGRLAWPIISCVMRISGDLA